MAVSLEMFRKNAKFITKSNYYLNLLNRNITRGQVSVRNASSSTQDAKSSERPTRPKLSWREEKISNAMKAYITFRKQNDAFLEEEVAKFEIGKRHLANIMGEDPKDMNQMKIDSAIEYLFPSGLTDKMARPQLKHPDISIPKAKVAQFGLDGRPFNPFYYTGFPNFYTIMHEAGQELVKLKNFEKEGLKRNRFGVLEDRVNTAGKWISKKGLETKTQERINDDAYTRLIVLLDKLLYHPYSARSEEFLQKYRDFYDESTGAKQAEPVEIDEQGRAFATAIGHRKTAKAIVKVVELAPDEHRATVSINGKSFLQYFPELRQREVIAFPLIFTGMLGKVHIEAQVRTPINTSPAEMCHAGAIRVALSRALTSFVEPEVAEQLRLMGMLTFDPRRRERKKPGQKKARKKFTWKAR